MIDPVLTFLIFGCDFHVECSVHPKFLKDIPVFLLLLWATHAGCFLLKPRSLLVTDPRLFSRTPVHEGHAKDTAGINIKALDHQGSPQESI